MKLTKRSISSVLPFVLLSSFACAQVASTLVPADAEWRYFPGTRQPAPGTTWTVSGFDDSDWETGRSGFGYGDGDDNTVLNDMQGSYVSVFVRHGFQLDDAKVSDGLRDGSLRLVLRVDYDDGFVAYLNGTEVARSGVDGSPPAYDAESSSHEAGTPEEFFLPEGTTLPAANLLALQGHNTDADSSDFSLIPELVVVPAPPEPSFRVLIFSKTSGFRHGSIGPGIAAVRALGLEHGFSVDTTENAALISDQNLAQYDVVMFLNTTGDILNSTQQAAFERFIQGGGGFAGVHSASDTEYGWPWYGRLLGAYFRNHPSIQEADIHVEDREHLSTAHLPETWERRDEWYNFRLNPRENVHVLATLDESTYSGGNMGADHPIAWCQEFDGGRSWYTAGGHTSDSYSEPMFREHLLGGILFASGQGSCSEPVATDRVIPGDCNADSRIDLSDGVCLLLILFAGADGALPCGDGAVADAANRSLLDHNGDELVNISDALSLLQNLFAAGPPHPLGTDCRSISGCQDVCAQ
ncbi:MAG: ThuA domain-containing protein [Planctomycetota bacterium]